MKIADIVQWLGNCPADDGQPFYETAVPVLDHLTTNLYELLNELGNSVLAERVREIRDGEIPAAADDPEWEVNAWQELANDIEANEGGDDEHE